MRHNAGEVRERLQRRLREAERELGQARQFTADEAADLLRATPDERRQRFLERNRQALRRGLGAR